MTKRIFILALAFISIQIAQAQKLKNGPVRIIFASGDEARFVGKNMEISETALTLQMKTAYGKKVDMSHELSRVRQIEVASNKWIKGLLIGTGAGIMGVLTYHNLREEDTYGYGSSRFSKKPSIVSFESAAILGGGTLLGFIVGHSVKEWTTVYSKEQSGNHQKQWKFNLGYNCSFTPVLTIKSVF